MRSEQAESSSSFLDMKRRLRSWNLSLQFCGVGKAGETLELRFCTSMAMESQLLLPCRLTAHASNSSSNVPQGCALVWCSLAMLLSCHHWFSKLGFLVLYIYVYILIFWLIEIIMLIFSLPLICIFLFKPLLVFPSFYPNKTLQIFFYFGSLSLPLIKLPLFLRGSDCFCTNIKYYMDLIPSSTSVTQK